MRWLTTAETDVGIVIQASPAANQGTRPLSGEPKASGSMTDGLRRAAPCGARTADLLVRRLMQVPGLPGSSCL
jgi:hypothetical protein